MDTFAKSQDPDDSPESALFAITDKIYFQRKKYILEK